MDAILISFKNPFADEELSDVSMLLNAALHVDGENKRLLVSGTCVVELNEDNTAKNNSD